MLLKILYSVLLGIALSFFIGLGVEAFYPTEKYPETPLELQYNTKEADMENTAVVKEHEKAMKEYQERMGRQSLITSGIVVFFSIVFMLLSLVVFMGNQVFSNGFLIASLLTLVYGVVRGFGNQDPKVHFAIISFSLVFVLIIGYLKFGKQLASDTKLK
jgi:hypothetical protein